MTSPSSRPRTTDSPDVNTLHFFFSLLFEVGPSASSEGRGCIAPELGIFELPDACHVTHDRKSSASCVGFRNH